MLLYSVTMKKISSGYKPTRKPVNTLTGKKLFIIIFFFFNFFFKGGGTVLYILVLSLSSCSPTPREGTKVWGQEKQSSHLWTHACNPRPVPLSWSPVPSPVILRADGSEKDCGFMQGSLPAQDTSWRHCCSLLRLLPVV